MARWLVRTGAASALVASVCMTDARVTMISAAGGRQHVGRGSVAAGRAHTVIATPDGRVSAWGAGGRGQIGDGALVDRWTPTSVAGLDAVVAVSAGAAHTVAVTKDGDVYAWGANTFGRLGDGTLQRRASPVRVQGVTGVIAVAAGRAHTLALDADGHVFAWGWNNHGQLGTGSRAPAIVPVQIRGLNDVVAIAAGDAHSLAVTRDGRVFAWGGNAFSALGDGSKKDRFRPVTVPITDVVAVAAGSSHSLALARSGAVYSWGRGANGELGTGTTKVATTPKIVPGLNAVAVAAGRHFSAAIRDDLHVVAWGANGSGQLGDHTTQRRLRPVTVDGLSSVASLALGDAHAIAVTTAGDVHTWGEGESGRLGNGDELDQSGATEVISDVPDWGLDDVGPPAVPSISPPTGVYPEPQLVTITAGSSTDVIRFTTDGAEPNQDAPIYTAPFTVATAVVVRAQSYSSRGEASGMATESYTIDLIPPSIVAESSPPVQQGWMTVPVTVTFTCADDIGVASCSGPVTVATDGPAQVITGTAVDRAGRVAVASVVVSLDLNPPALSISEPQNNSTIDANEVALVGSADDGASGVADVRCNGAAADVSGGVVRCSIVLQPGRNDVILHATDVAGHNASSAIVITRVGSTSQIALSPAARVIEVNEMTSLTLHDQFGAVVDQARWATSDDAVVQLSDDDPPMLRALAAGAATITAEKDGLTATASVEVLPAMLAGTTRWTLPALPGLTPGTPLFANRVDASVPQMFAVESNKWGEATLRAVTAEGQVLWQQHSPGIPLMGDSFGGVLSGVLYDVNSGTDFRAYLRLGGGSTQPWRYESRGALAGPAQAHDGTLYAVEYLFGGLNIDGKEVWDANAVVIDGATGGLISRTLLPREVDEFISERDGEVLGTKPPIYCKSLYHDFAPAIMGPVVGSDGRGYLVVRRHALHKRGDCIESRLRPDRTIEMGLDLVILSPTAAPQTISLSTTTCSGTLGTTLPCDLPVRAFQVLPDGIGGTLVTWERGTAMIGTAINVQRSMTRIDGGGTLQERPVGLHFWLELIGQAGTALTYDAGMKVMDVVTGDIKWAGVLPGLSPLAARPDGGLALTDALTGQLKITDANGAIESAQPLGLDWRAVHDSGDWIGPRGSAVVAVAGDFDDATRWRALRGNSSGQQRLRMPGFGIWLKTHNAFSVFPFRHTSIRVTPLNQKWLFQNRQLFENCEPASACVPLGQDVFGNYFFTVGAGAGTEDTSLLCTGILTKGFNRPKDVREPPAEPMRELPIDWQLQAVVVNLLLAQVAGYNNDLAYHCFPEEHPGFYNSNSFTHGLLHAAGVSHEETPPSRRPIPGWLTLVPFAAFSR